MCQSHIVFEFKAKAAVEVIEASGIIMYVEVIEPTQIFLTDITHFSALAGPICIIWRFCHSSMVSMLL